MIKDVSIVFPGEGLTTGCEVEEIGKDLYILREHPLMSDSAMYGDTIEAVEDSPGQIRFVKVVQESDSQMYDFILTKEIVESEQFKKLKVRLSDNNIFWQNDFGGCFTCFVPQGCSIDIEHEIKQIIT
ncbi:hypothetical protein A9Q99_10210 [Gammaproteobacteria bacterium 45_16_T64]|nr:hypothetical protein A9Q99_10210 [Gammaproteobacteria bacterium 45_16_T64]